MAIKILKFIKPWYDSEEFGRVTVTRETSSLAKVQSLSLLENFRKSGGLLSDTYKEQNDTWKAGAAECASCIKFESKKKRLWFQKPPDSEPSDCRSFSETDSDDFDYGVLMD